MDSVEGNSRGSLQLVSELSRVQELVRQLEMHLHAPDSSVDLCRNLAAQIFALTDRSIGIVAATPRSGTPSPLSDDASADQPFRIGGCNGKKRKAAAARWTSRRRVSAAAGGGAEGPGDDGHSWRKYGQKDILGAKHPRGYYRCTHRNSQGCAATKQVQRADEDPTAFDVVYHGEHTCRPAGSGRRSPPQHNPNAHSLLQSLSAGLTVDTDDHGNSLHAAVVSPLTPENRSGASPSMASPVASDSNGGLQAMSPYPVFGYTDWPSSDSDLQEVVSGLALQPAMDADLMPYFFDFHQTLDMDMPSLFQ